MAAKATDVLGVPVHACDDVLAAALHLAQRGGGQIVTLNAEMTMAARAQPELGRAIAAARACGCAAARASNWPGTCWNTRRSPVGGLPWWAHPLR